MSIRYMNRLVPKGYTVVYREAEDESVDDEYGVCSGDGSDTGVAIQVGSGDLCVSKCSDTPSFSIRHWPPRDYDETDALMDDLTKALELSE